MPFKWVLPRETPRRTLKKKILVNVSWKFFQSTLEENPNKLLSKNNISIVDKKKKHYRNQQNITMPYINKINLVLIQTIVNNRKTFIIEQP